MGRWRYGDNGYTLKQVRHLIERYQELRSTAEVAATRYGPVAKNRGAISHGLEDIICMLVDLDLATATLPRRQRAVVSLAQAGYPPERISRKLGIKVTTAKTHFERAIVHITRRLNGNSKVPVRKGKGR